MIDGKTANSVPTFINNTLRGIFGPAGITIFRQAARKLTLVFNFVTSAIASLLLVVDFV